MTELSDFSTLWKVIRRLDQASIPYMLTGSMALNAYGHVRATNDIDIVIQVSAAEKEKIVPLFEKDFYISKEAVLEALNTETMFNVIDNETIFKVDFIIAKQDSFSKQQFQRRREILLDAQKIYVISPEDLILSKLEWSRESFSEMQERDIQNILRVQKGNLDQKYLETWADQKGFRKRLDQLYAKVGYTS